MKYLLLIILFIYLTHGRHCYVEARKHRHNLVPAKDFRSRFGTFRARIYEHCTRNGTDRRNRGLIPIYIDVGDTESTSLAIESCGKGFFLDGSPIQFRTHLMDARMDHPDEGA